VEDPPEIFNTALCAGFNARGVLKELRRRHLLHLTDEQYSPLSSIRPEGVWSFEAFGSVRAAPALQIKHRVWAECAIVRAARGAPDASDPEEERALSIRGRANLLQLIAVRRSGRARHVHLLEWRSMAASARLALVPPSFHQHRYVDQLPPASVVPTISMGITVRSTLDREVFRA
jgi:hypothetical protein